MQSKSRYRIVLINSLKDSGDVSTSYEVQKKVNLYFFSFWMNAPIICHYHTYEGMAVLTKRHYSYKDIDQAKFVMSFLSSKRTFRYKGNRISKYLDDSIQSIVFVNKSRYQIRFQSIYYEYSHSENEIKALIDSRIVTKTKEVIC